MKFAWVAAAGMRRRSDRLEESGGGAVKRERVAAVPVGGCPAVPAGSWNAVVAR